MKDLASQVRNIHRTICAACFAYFTPAMLASTLLACCEYNPLFSILSTSNVTVHRVRISQMPRDVAAGLVAMLSLKVSKLVSTRLISTLCKQSNYRHKYWI
jgi:hypothetical protein